MSHPLLSILDRLPECAKLEVGKIGPLVRVSDADCCHLSRLQKDVSRRRPVCRQVWSLSKVQDCHHGAGVSAEVKVHDPGDFSRGGRTASGKLALKPIARKQIKFQPVAAAIVAGASLAIILAAWVGGKIGLLNLNGWRGYAAVTLALAIISPALVVAAYSFLRDDELEPYRGKSLYLRAALCALGYIVLWGVFGYVTGCFPMEELWSWAFVAPPFFVVGSLGAYGALDLEFGGSFLLYSFYVLITIFLRWVAGMGWVWNIAAPPTM